MTVETALQAVAASADGRYGVLLEHGTLEIGYYAPKKLDPQSPHDQDEVYIISAGNGTFLNEGREQAFKPGDVLFVPAGVEHRFRDFTEDFGAWVVFFGPKGGEAEK